MGEDDDCDDDDDDDGEDVVFFLLLFSKYEGTVGYVPAAAAKALCCWRKKRVEIVRYLAY